MTVQLSGQPQRGCRCLPCRQVRTRLLDRLTPHQRACLDAVDRAIPRDPRDVRERARVTAGTTNSLVHPRRPVLALMTEVRLRRVGERDDPVLPFLILTDLGRDVKQPALRT